MNNNANLANSILAKALASSDTSAQLQPGDGSNMPPIPFKLTITPYGLLPTKANSEIVLVTAISTDIVTITRAQDGTTAQSFPAGSIIGNGIYIEDVQTALDAKANASDLTAHTSNTSNPHSVTKAQVGLENVSNLAPADMPVSTAQAAALALKANANATVNLTGDQTIAGVKTFTSAPIAPSGTSIGGVLYLTGSGFPNGVVSASVGSIYIDTAVTNGASSWIKKSGTGNTGWQVLEGDTGWRNLGPIWEQIAEPIYIRRDRFMCYVTTFGEGLTITGKVVNSRVTMDAGFKPFGRAELLITNNGAIVGRILVKQFDVALFLTTNTIGIYNAIANSSYLTAEPWPATLPGTPA